MELQTKIEDVKYIYSNNGKKKMTRLSLTSSTCRDSEDTRAVKASREGFCSSEIPDMYWKKNFKPINILF